MSDQVPDSVEGAAPADGKPATPTAPPPSKPVLKWHEAKKTKRDLLCLAVTNEGWDFLQKEGGMAETIVTEAEYDAAIERARDIWSSCLRMVKRPSNAVVLAHPKELVAMIIRRPTATEAEALTKTIRDEALSEEATTAKLRDDLMLRSLWPKEATEPMAHILEDSPLSFLSVFPAMVQEAAGSDAFAKKTG